MEGLGALGFWLGLGIFLAGGAVAGAMKEIAKEREKQATLRALLERGGQGTPEILAYLREKDAAQAARDHAAWVAMGGNVSLRTTFAGIVAALVGMFGFLGGLIAFGEANHPGEPWQGPIAVLFGFWVGGLIAAFLIFFFFRDRKKAPPPGE